MASSLNEESVEKKLKTVNNTQDSIQSLSLWIIHHKTHHARICQLWMKVLKKTVQPSHRLTLFYLCNDVIQNCKKKAYVYNTTFKEHLREAACLVRDLTVKKKVERIFNIWGERNVYDAAFVKTLQEALNGKSDKSKKKSHSKVKHHPLEEEVYNGPISPVASPIPHTDPGSKSISPVAETREEEQTEHDEEESARILAEFKPHEMIEQITAFTRQATDIKFKLSQITNLKLHDMSSAEAVKRLKDRSHGNDFSNQVEDTCNKLSDLVKRQRQHLEDQKLLLQTLNTSETFYEEQYREARIVANAYKNFGARINNIKKKLDELKRSFPQPDSPVPSPDMNAPSPGNTPPHLNTSSASFNYNPGAQASINSHTASWYNGTGAAMGAVQGTDQVDVDLYNASPPLEAPSPEGSPQDLNLGNSESGSGSLESRLANFFNQGRPSNAPAPRPSVPVYTPQLPASLAAAKLSSKQAPNNPPVTNVGAGGEEDGSTTPLDDEAPTTPVQDEVSSSSPPPPPKSSQLRNDTPPKKENPIDFLSRLISQTQKGNNSANTKTGAASFLDSLTMLSSGSATKRVEPPAPISTPITSQPWNSWQANTSPTINNSVSSSSLSPPFTPLPNTSLSKSPQPVPPPPIPLPVPPPPMALTMNLNLPPPPPPPFLTTPVTPVPPPDFSSPPPPPMFQQTSPGQKENWPDVNSMLKPSQAVGVNNTVDSFGNSGGNTAPSRLVDPDIMEIVSDEDEATLGIETSTGATSSSVVIDPSDAATEFINKLRQKTQASVGGGGTGPLKSSVFVPNSERSNLKSLASDDLEDIDSRDSKDSLEDKSWKKGSHRSRSRSKSRDKERSHKHKKKKKHKKGYRSDDDDQKFGDDGKAYGSLGSTVKKVSSRNSRDSRDNKYDDDRRYEKYDDRDSRKYHYDEKPYDEKPYRRDDKYHKSSSSSNSGHRISGGDDNKNDVEAYAQAYRNALLQQYQFNAPPPFGGPPPSGPLLPPPGGHDSRHFGNY